MVPSEITRQRNEKVVKEEEKEEEADLKKQRVTRVTVSIVSMLDCFEPKFVFV